MTAGSVASSSALCTVLVAGNAIQQDVILKLVLKLASPLQVKIVADIRAKTSQGGVWLQCGPHEHGNLLKHRNSIVRALCGMGLHHAVDLQHKLLGGHASTVRSSLTSQLALASIVEWMTVASQLRTAPSNNTFNEVLLSRLETHLQAHAFLVPSPSATIADFDVAVSMMTHSDLLFEAVTPPTRYPHTCRWLRQCHAELQHFGIEDICKASKVTLRAPPPVAPIVPIFFNGTETIQLTTTPATKATSAVAAATSKPPKNASATTTNKNESSIVEYNIGALDIRVGHIVEVWEHESADKLFCEVIEIGNGEQPRHIASGLRPYYQASDLQGKKVLVLCNLKARNLVGFPSHGMVLCASNDDHTKVELVVPPEDAPVGARIVFDGYEHVAPEPENKMAKKRIFESLAVDLKTNQEGCVVWKNALAKVQMSSSEGSVGGRVKALNGMPNAHVS